MFMFVVFILLLSNSFLEEIFKMEYWSLEQAKLKNLKRKYFSGNVVLISGGCGDIGLSTAKSFYDEGAEVILLDKEQHHINKTPSSIKKFAKMRIILIWRLPSS